MQNAATALIALILTTALYTGCAKPGPDLESRYKWTQSSAPDGEAAHGITGIEVIKNGKRIARWRITEGGTGKLPFRGHGMPVAVDAPGSHDIRIEIDPEAKSTTYAGLVFTEPCVVEIRDDGTLLVDQEGLSAKDNDAKEWVSQKVKLGDQDAIAFFPAN